MRQQRAVVKSQGSGAGLRSNPSSAAHLLCNLGQIIEPLRCLTYKNGDNNSNYLLMLLWGLRAKTYIKVLRLCLVHIVYVCMSNTYTHVHIYEPLFTILISHLRRRSFKEVNNVAIQLRSVRSILVSDLWIRLYPVGESLHHHRLRLRSPVALGVLRTGSFYLQPAPSCLPALNLASLERMGTMASGPIKYLATCREKITKWTIQLKRHICQYF